MAAPRRCADGPCCSHPGAAPGVQQTLDEMDFERGEGARLCRPCPAGGPRPRGRGGKRPGAGWRGPGRSAGRPWARRSRATGAAGGLARAWQLKDRLVCRSGDRHWLRQLSPAVRRDPTPHLVPPRDTQACSGVSEGRQSLHPRSCTHPEGIWSAALNGDLGRVKYLIQKAVDPSQPDSAGYTALHYASRNGHYAVCQFLLESGAKCDAQTHGGATALHRASYCGHTDVARLLLAHGSNPRLVDADGMTSLHKAAEKGHVDICSLLLQHSPALKAVRDRKARLACDLLPGNSDLRDLLAS